MKNIMAYNNSIIRCFVWENRKSLELIKTVKVGDIYVIKNTDIFIYISEKEDFRTCFNNQIFKNLMKCNNLKIDIIKDLFYKGIFYK